MALENRLKIETERLAAQKKRVEEERAEHEAKLSELGLSHQAALTELKTRLADEEREYEQVAAQRLAKAEQCIETEKAKARYATSTVYAAGTSIVLLLCFELAVHLLPWTWLVTHPNSYGLQLAVDAILVCGTIGLFFPNHRKLWWFGAACAFFVGISQIVGGPSSTNP